jgi:hypothetical protein
MKKFFPIYGAAKFIVDFIAAQHWALSFSDLHNVIFSSMQA